MAYPNKALQLFSFTGFSNSSPTSQQPGSSLDQEFNEARRAVTEIVDYLEASRLDSLGNIKPLAVNLDQLDPELAEAIFGTATPDWTAYENQIVAARDAAQAAQTAAATAQTGAETAETGAVTAQTAAESARDAAQAAAGGFVEHFKTVAEAQAATIDVNFQHALILEPRGFYKRVSAAPAHQGKFRSADRFMPDGSTNATNGGWWEINPERGSISVDKYGALGDGVADDTAAIQSAWDVAFATGGELFFPAGKYRITAAVVGDLRGVLGAPNTNTRRVNIRGEGKGNTVILPSTDLQVAFRIIGDNPFTTASHAYITISDIAFGGNSPTARTTEALRLEDVAYLDVVGVSFNNLKVGLNLIGCLSSNFSGCVFNEGVTGVESDAGASGPHANFWSGCEFRQLTKLAYDGFTSMAQGVFIGCQFEGCGTQGMAGNGGLHFRMSGAAGEVGPTFIGCYFEGNGGDFDVFMEETGVGNERIAASFLACNFNRISSTKFVTNNIKTAGSIDVNLSGCAFSHFNTYAPNAGRPYLSLSLLGRFRDGGNRYESATEGPTISQGLPYAGWVEGSLGASVAGTLPSGWAVSQGGTGIFIVTHNLGHTNYSVTATADSALVRTVERAVIGANQFQVVLTDAANVKQDTDFSFLLVELKPGG